MSEDSKASPGEPGLCTDTVQSLSPDKSELAALATFDPAVTKALPFKRPTPEDSELAKKRAELSPLAAILAQRELELATLQVELREFEARYLRIVGVRYTKLDEIERCAHSILRSSSIAVECSSQLSVLPC